MTKVSSHPQVTKLKKKTVACSSIKLQVKNILNASDLRPTVVQILYCSSTCCNLDEERNNATKRTC